MPDMQPMWRLTIRRAQAIWLLLAGILLFCLPGQWFGRAWPLVDEIPGLPFAIGVAYVGLGMALWLYAHGRHRKRVGLILLLAGVLNWVIGVVLFLSAVQTNLSIMAGPFPLYVGAHMLLGSAGAYSRVSERQ
jgi:hypothetical protein